MIYWVTSNVLFWIGYAAVLASLFFLSNAIYQLYVSPLRRFPGPKLWAVSRIPLQLSVVRGHNHLDVTALHAIYGPVVRISPNELAFNTPDAFRDIYGARPGGCFLKDRSHYLPPVNGVDHILCAVDHSMHARQIKLLAPAFSDRALRDQEDLIQGYVDTLIKKLHLEIEKHGSGTRFDIKQWMNYTTFDITGDLMFGVSFDCLKETCLHPWIDLIFKSMKALSLAGVAHQFPLIGMLMKVLVPREVARKAQQHFDLAASRVDHRIATQMDRPDFISAMLQNGLSENEEQSLDDDRIISRAEIHSNAFILIIAGSETVATLLSGCIYYLCSNPLMMSRLVSEIRTSFLHDKDITFQSTLDLSYLAAVIEESLRIYPPFVTSLSRIVPKGGSMIDGRFVPGKTVVACHHYASYRSPTNFSSPNDFIPDRWLGKSPAFDADRKDTLQPFSLGPRSCIGKRLAYSEARLILCKLLLHFDITLCPESKTWTDQEVYFLWDKPALMVKLHPRFVESRSENVTST